MRQAVHGPNPSAIAFAACQVLKETRQKGWGPRPPSKLPPTRHAQDLHLRGINAFSLGHRQFPKGQPEDRVLDGRSTHIVLPRELSPLAFTKGNPQSSLKNLLCGELSFSGGTSNPRGRRVTVSQRPKVRRQRVGEPVDSVNEAAT